MLSRLFRAHGQFCAARPWEVIIGTISLTFALLSVSWYASSDKICGYNYKCVDESDVMTSDVYILGLVRCLAVVYVYLQFRQLRRLGSKYLLGIAVLFTMFASFAFSITFINFVGGDLTKLNEALPFFLFMVELSKASSLARFALSSSSQDEVRDNIGRGMAVLGPALTLDALVETLSIGVGTLSGIPTLETMCCLGCLSVLTHYLAFMTFYPAALALVLELTRSPGHKAIYSSQLLLTEENEEKPNPVTQRVKAIMAVALVLVHAGSRWAGAGASVSSLSYGHKIVPPTEHLFKFFLLRLLTPDYLVTGALTLVLSLKYIFFDDDNLISDLSEHPASMLNVGEEPITQSELSHSSSQSPDANQPQQNYKVKPSFFIGEYCDSEESSEDASTCNVGTQTADLAAEPAAGRRDESVVQSLDKCVAVMQSDDGPAVLSDAEVMMLVKSRHIPSYKLENMLGSYERGIAIRRKMIAPSLASPDALDKLPYLNYDYSFVDGACCENVIGYMPVPVGYAGPLVLDGKKLMVPMATTEGCLVASTNRGCRAMSGGVTSVLLGDGMTRAPVVRFPSVKEAAECQLWLEEHSNFLMMAEAFNSTTRFGRLKKLQAVCVSHDLFIRFVAFTGDAMGMNMISKGAEKALDFLNKNHFPNMEILSLSGNFCTDKKHSAINWIEGRGKSVVCEAIVPEQVVKNVLKTTVPALIELNTCKNYTGSAVAGSIGGNNAQAANIVTAVYIAAGQDPAQNVTSSYCMTFMTPSGPDGSDLCISCRMPALEVGTIGGGTVLPPQAACLKMLGVQGANKEKPGANAQQLARIVCAAVMAGELSLMSALAAGHLVKSHLKHNRSALNVGGPTLLGPIKEDQGESTTPGTCIARAS